MINILMCGNSYVFKGWLLMTLSMTKHTKEPITMYCFTMDLSSIKENFTPISEKQAQYIEDILKQTNKDSKVVLIDLTKQFMDTMLDSVNLKNHFTPYSMLRLYADTVPEIPDKIIYLDTDTMINNDISELFNIDIEDVELACVKDAYNWASPSRWKIINTYFNAGVFATEYEQNSWNKIVW